MLLQWNIPMTMSSLSLLEERFCLKEYISKDKEITRTMKEKELRNKITEYSFTHTVSLRTYKTVLRPQYTFVIGSVVWLFLDRGMVLRATTTCIQESNERESDRIFESPSVLFLTVLLAYGEISLQIGTLYDIAKGGER